MAKISEYYNADGSPRGLTNVEKNIMVVILLLLLMVALLVVFGVFVLGYYLVKFAIKEYLSEEHPIRGHWLFVGIVTILCSIIIWSGYNLCFIFDSGIFERFIFGLTMIYSAFLVGVAFYGVVSNEDYRF